MAIVAYYKDGLPHEASGQVIIEILGGPKPMTTVNNPIGHNPNAPAPVYTPWPAGPRPMSGQPAYDPARMPRFTSYSGIMAADKNISDLLAAASKTYPLNIATVKTDSDSTIKKIEVSFANDDVVLLKALKNLQEANTALDVALADEVVATKNLAEKTKLAQAGTERGIKMFKMDNFRSKPNLWDAVVATMSHSPGYMNYWEDNVTKPKNEEYLAKNNLLTLKNRVTLITSDVIKKTAELESELKTAEQRKQDADLKEIVQSVFSNAATIADKYGEKIGAFAKELANNVEGKTIRSYQEAVEMFAKIEANPNLKLSTSDKSAIADAITAFNKETLAQNLNRLGKSLGIVDKGFTAETLYQKTTDGFKTGDWEPLMLEIEAIALSGVAAAVATKFITAALLSIPAMPLAIPAVVGIGLTLILTGIISSYIDADMAKKLNNELISSAY